MKSKILLLALMGTTILSACSPKENKTNTTINKKIENNDNLYFYIDKNKKVLTEKEVKEKKLVILNIYFDPSCGACIYLENYLKDKIENILGDKGVIKFHPIAPLNSHRVDGYSAKASSFILAIAEKEPEIAFDFFKEVMESGFCQVNHKQIFIEMEKEIENIKDLDTLLNTIQTNLLRNRVTEENTKVFLNNLKESLKDTKIDFNKNKDKIVNSIIENYQKSPMDLECAETDYKALYEKVKGKDFDSIKKIAEIREKEILAKTITFTKDKEFLKVFKKEKSHVPLVIFEGDKEEITLSELLDVEVYLKEEIEKRFK